MTKEFDARNENKSRSVCAAMAEAADTGKRVLSEKERRILDMWPRFEDGEPVMIGDGVDGLGGEIIEVYIAENAADIWNNAANHMHLRPGERVKRPAPDVLDADGVLIKVGDTVWHEDGSELHVIGFGGVQDGETMLVVEYAAGPTKWGEVRCLSVTHTRPAPKVLDADGVEIHVGDTVWDDDGVEMTVMSLVGELPGHVTTHSKHPPATYSINPKRLAHTRPDSWERLEEDARELARDNQLPHDVDQMERDAVDLIRRAKKLAGVE